jgi:hypothetical protein
VPDETAWAGVQDIRVCRGRRRGGKQTITTFDDQKIEELAAEIERRPGFKDAEARKRFPTELRRWASFWLHQAGSSARPLPKKKRGTTASLSDPTPREVQDTLRQLESKARTFAEQVRRHASELDRALYPLPQAVRDALGWHMPPDPAADRPPSWASLPEDLQRRAQGKESFNRLCADLSSIKPWLRRSVDAAEQCADVARKAAMAQAKVRTGPRPAKLGKAIHDLGRIWFELTGVPPRLGSSAYSPGARGPFGNFVHAVVPLLWPGAGSMAGYIRDVCRSYREHPAQ